MNEPSLFVSTEQSVTKKIRIIHGRTASQVQQRHTCARTNGERREKTRVSRFTRVGCLTRPTVCVMCTVRKAGEAIKLSGYAAGARTAKSLAWRRKVGLIGRSNMLHVQVEGQGTVKLYQVQYLYCNSVSRVACARAATQK